ncbi:hypothetical protein VNO77_10614 [Canavalia gladiata]|uniref:Uncharacterized protein n=1 Tax=Canavalia gladiata TaxID=3824 RepID=A0AAN9R266_CANGL
MNIASRFLRAPPSSAEMNHSKCLEFIKRRVFCWIIKVLLIEVALLATTTSEGKVEGATSSDIFCISDCDTCPVICSPPPPPPILTTKSYPPPSPSIPHSPSPSYFTFSPPPHKPHSPPPSSPPPPPSPPPFNSYSTPNPTVVAGPHDFSYPYYYFYASAASSPSIHASFFVSLFFLIAYLIPANYY